MVSTFLIDFVNMWLTLSITIIRYLAISQMTFRLYLKHTKYVFLSVFCISLVHKIPSFVLAVIKTLDIEDNPSDIYFVTDVIDRVHSNNGSYVNYVMDSVACLLLAIFSCLIICVIYKGAQRHRKITRRSVVVQGNVWKQTTRTTLTILAMTLATTVCKCVVVFQNICFLHTHYRPGEQINGSVCYSIHYIIIFKKSLHIINSGINIFFFIVSKDFRKTLKKIVCCQNSRVADPRSRAYASKSKSIPVISSSTVTEGSRSSIAPPTLGQGEARGDKKKCP